MVLNRVVFLLTCIVYKSINETDISLIIFVLFDCINFAFFSLYGAKLNSLFFYMYKGTRATMVSKILMIEFNFTLGVN
jgi:hypothetical protein